MSCGICALSAVVLMSHAPLPVQQQGRGTYLTWNNLGSVRQSIVGFWTVTDDEGSTLLRFDLVNSGSRLVLMAGQGPPLFHPELQPYQQQVRGGSGGTLGQYGADGAQFRGLRSTIERSGKRCTQFNWWMPSTLSFDNTQTVASENTFDPSPDEQCNAKRPSDGTTLHSTMKRVVGVTFAPLANGRYMAYIISPTVGSQYGQYKGTAKLRWDYTGIRVARVMLRVARPGGGDSPLNYPLRGEYDLVAMQPGTYAFELQLIGATGSVVHSDHATVVLPGVR